MHLLAIRNATRNTVLGDRIAVADGSLGRLVGLLTSRRLEPGAGLLLVPSQAVHTIGMRFAIDVVFVDRDWRAIGLRAEMPPLRLSRVYYKAWAALELPAGAIALSATSAGDQLAVEDSA